MRYIVGFTRAQGETPFHVHEGNSAPPGFSVGDRIRPDPAANGWLQVTAVGHQLHPQAIVTTVVVSEATNIGSEGSDFASWPWN